MGEMWPGKTEESKDRRGRNRAWSAAKLRSEGVPFMSKNDGAHLILKRTGHAAIDFWPGTGKWIPRGGGEPRRGIRSLLRYLRNS